MEDNQPKLLAAPAAVADAPAKKVRVVNTKPKANATPAVKPKPTAKAADAPKVKQLVNTHIEAGLDVTMYSGLSSFVNKNRQTKIMQHGETRATGSLTDRMQKALYALRKTYGGKQFGVRGFDNGILSHLAAAKLIDLSGGKTENVNGSTYLLDGETKVMGRLTAAGQKYGIA
jgi:hypothetical protein